MGGRLPDWSTLLKAFCAVICSRLNCTCPVYEATQNNILKKLDRMHYIALQLRCGVILVITECLCWIRRAFIISYPWETLSWIIFLHTFTYITYHFQITHIIIIYQIPKMKHYISIFHFAFYPSASEWQITIHGSPLENIKIKYCFFLTFLPYMG